MTYKLKNGYEIRELPEDVFFKKYTPLKKVVFSQDHSLFPHEYMSNQEKEQADLLRAELYKNRYALHLGVFDPKGHLVGWHFGFQENPYTFYMCNSAILAEHRRQGLYQSLLEVTKEIIKKKGFQVILSRHTATNNPVIIPKLKAGFVISSLEVDDVFGVLVHLKYFFNPTRLKVMNYRAGQIHPDDELKKLFKLDKIDQY